MRPSGKHLRGILESNERRMSIDWLFMDRGLAGVIYCQPLSLCGCWSMIPARLTKANQLSWFVPEIERPLENGYWYLCRHDVSSMNENHSVKAYQTLRKLTHGQDCILLSIEAAFIDQCSSGCHKKDLKLVRRPGISDRLKGHSCVCCFHNYACKNLYLFVFGRIYIYI